MSEEEYICNLAFEIFGKDFQFKIAVEELAELIVELVKYGRDLNSSTLESISNEVADVEVVLKHIKLLLGISKDVEKIRGKKFDRLLRRLEEAKLKKSSLSPQTKSCKGAGGK